MKMLNFIRYLKEMAEGSSHVTTFMRANPPTAGHQKVVDKVKEIASKNNAIHSVVLSHSHDPEKNPLTSEQKIKHAKRAFPNTNISTSSREKPSFLHHASDLSSQGVKHLHVVVGQDRVSEFKNILNKYNGQEGKHGKYNFKSITVHSAGNRDPDAEGVEGISATMMRNAARNKDRKTFHAGASANMSPKEKDEMMKDVRSGMGIKG
jgi:Cytidylyltransferase-like